MSERRSSVKDSVMKSQAEIGLRRINLGVEMDRDDVGKVSQSGAEFLVAWRSPIQKFAVSNQQAHRGRERERR